MGTPWFCPTSLQRLMVVSVLCGLGASGCSDPTAPREYRGVGLYETESLYVTEIVRLIDRGMVLDISFIGPCGVTEWDVQASIEGETVEVTPYFTAIPSVNRCASAVRFIEGFQFLRGDSARFVVHAEPDVFPRRPVEVVLDTVVAFRHAYGRDAASLGGSPSRSDVPTAYNNKASGSAPRCGAPSQPTPGQQGDGLAGGVLAPVACVGEQF